MSKKRRARVRAEAPLWTEIELAFFAAAPPDDPAPAAEPERFDDLDGNGDGGGGRPSSFWSALRRLFAPRRPRGDQPAMRAARSSSLLA